MFACGSELADNSRFDDSPSPSAWSTHDALFRVGIGKSEDDRQDAFTVYKDGRVCTADGTVSKCGDEDEVAAAARRKKEESQRQAIEELQAEVKALKLELKRQQDQMDRVLNKLRNVPALNLEMAAAEKVVAEHAAAEMAAVW